MMMMSHPLRGTRRMAGALTLASVLALGLGSVPVAATTPSSVAPPGRAPVASTTAPLAGVARYLATRSGVAQVAVFNRSTGTTATYANGKATQVTASIVKVDILAMWLHRYEEQGVAIPAGIPYSIQYLMQQMIEASNNAAATALFYYGGGCDALTAFNTLIPTKATTVGCETATYYGWGNTTTTAADQVAIMKTFALANPVLGPDARAYGLGLMENVQSTQRWGVSCGPWGVLCYPPDYAVPVPSVTVALKNGWKYVPTCAAQDETCPWQINSIGAITGMGRDYVIAILTTNNPPGPGLDGFNYGVDTVQNVSQLVWKNLGG